MSDLNNEVRRLEDSLTVFREELDQVLNGKEVPRAWRNEPDPQKEYADYLRFEIELKSSALSNLLLRLQSADSRKFVEAMREHFPSFLRAVQEADKSVKRLSKELDRLKEAFPDLEGELADEEDN